MPDKKFKYKSLDLDLDKYLYNLSQNAESWVNSQDWTDSLKQEFWNAYDIYKTKLQETNEDGYSNLSINDRGLVVGPELTNEDNDDYYYKENGKRIEGYTYAGLGRRKQKRYSAFEANRQVATYLNIIAKAYSDALPLEKDPIKNTKTPKKESFSEYFLRTKGLNDDGDFNYFLELDTLDPTTRTRGFTERIKVFNDALSNYINTLEDTDKTKFSDLKTHLETNGFDSTAKVKMLGLGIDNEFFEKYFNPYENVSIDESAYKKYLEKLAETAKNNAALEEKALEEQALKERDKEILDAWNIFLLSSESEPKTIKLRDSEGLEILDSFELNPFNKSLYDPIIWVPKIEKILIPGGVSTDTWLNLQLSNSIDRGDSLNRHILYWLLYERGFKDTYNGRTVVRIKGDNDVDKKHTLIWDPAELKLQLIPLILSGSGEKELLESFKKSKPDLFPKKPYILPYSKGGLIKKLQYGGMLEYYGKMIRTNAKKKNISLEKYKQDNESLWDDWELTDMIDLGTIAADLVSAGAALSPGVGTVISAVSGGLSTGTQFVNDLLKDGFQWSDVASLATNAGADVVGLVPGLGVAGKLGKHITKLQKYLPKVIKILGIAGTAYQTPAIMETLGRIGSGEELKKSDLQTLALIGKGLLIGGRKLGNSRNKKMPGTKAYPFEDKDNFGEIEYKLFTGADAQALSKAKDHSTINEILSKYKTGTYTPVVQEDYTFSLNVGRLFDREPKKYNITFNPVSVRRYNKKGILRETKTYSIPTAFKVKKSKKNGGTINKFQTGGKNIRNTSSTANWILHMFDTDAMKTYLNSINVDNYEDFNDLLNSWYSNKTSTGYNPGISNISYSDDVKNRQVKYNSTGLNANIEDLVDQGIIVPKGSSGDNVNSGWVDGYFGELEYLRHFGTKESFQNSQQELSNTIEFFKNKGLDYYLDDTTGMYLLKPLQSLKQVLQGVTDPVKQDPKKENSKGNNARNKTYRFLRDLVSPGMSLGRAIYADNINRRITDLALESEKPYLIDPFVYNRYVQGNLDAINLGDQEAISLNNILDKYSDPTLNFAMRLERYKLGLDRKRHGRMLDNQAMNQSKELVWLQGKENALNEHETGLKNRLSIMQSEANRNKYEQAYLAKLHEVWDTFWKEMQYDYKIADQQRKEAQAAFDLRRIEKSVKTDLGSYATNLSPDALAVWDGVNSGTIILNPNDTKQMNLYKLAKLAFIDAVWEELGKNLNLYMASTTPSYNWLPNIYLKNGGRIKERIANAERLFKTIKSDLDRNEKKLDRLFKSLYTLKNKVK